MHVAVAWIVTGPTAPDALRRARARVEGALEPLVPSSYERTDMDGEGWGLLVLRPAASPYRWPVVATQDGVTAVSLGLPVGASTSGGPTALARRLLVGEDVHAGVVPPFGLLALRDGSALAVQQDWLGMCRLFVGERDGLTVLATRPTLVSASLDRHEPDLAGWASYAQCGHFADESSPVAAARLLAPGERLVGDRAPDGVWRVTSHRRTGVDDVVRRGLESRGSADALLDLAADSFRRTSASVSDLVDGDLRLGLSGGKDSRLIAASFVASGAIPMLVTNEDTAAEGETARELVARLRRRGYEVEHRLVTSGAPTRVAEVGLVERARRLQRQYDFQFPSTYLARPAEAGRLPETSRPPSITGAGGEIASAYWYPAGDGEVADDDLVPALRSHVLAAVTPGVAEPWVVEHEQARADDLLARARALGLPNGAVLDYAYLMERVRRWATSAYVVGMVTPFLAPDVVSATFALAPEDKRARSLHDGLLRRLVPEWADVPYVSVTTGTSTAARVWDGAGLEALCGLADGAHGPLAGLLRRPAVVDALAAARRGGTRSTAGTLQQFAALAVADGTFDPGALSAATGEHWRRLTAPPARPSVVRRARRRLGELRGRSRSR